MWQDIKETVFGLVHWAEKELPGKSGAGKRAAVVEKACAIINIPYLPDWIENMFKPILIGWIADKVCNVFNILFEHDFGNTELTPEQVSKAAGLVEATPRGTGIVPDEADLPIKVVAAVREAGDIDAKLARLYEEYAGK
ncbi:MAG: hypothetical protein LBR71_02120 [Synergistaceae bacterium]|jgi:hypothetical protein|nr:hypothetical protein [Synergistaceae bacterium]